MAPDASSRFAPRAVARITGAPYLAFMVTSVLANVLGHIGLGDAVDMYGSITSAPASFRLGLVVAFVSTFLFLMAAWGLTSCCAPSAATWRCCSFSSTS